MDDRRPFSLDEDVNSYLKSWKIPSNDYQLHEKVTMRRILQQLLIDVTGESFPSLMKRQVFEPIGMICSTYEQPLPEARRNAAASGHDGKGAVVPGKWPVQPEMAAGGLCTTPTDLAKWAIEISNAWNGRSTKLLSRKMAAEMLTVQKPPYGLGLVLEGKDQAFSFGHRGSTWGFRAQVVRYPEVGKGAVIMTNADLGDALMGEVMMSIASEYHWPAGLQSEREVVTLTTEQLDGLVGIYMLPPGPSGAPVTYEVSREGEQLFFELKGLGQYPKGELYAASANSFFTVNGLSIAFVRDGSGRAEKVKLEGQVEGTRRQ